MSRMSIVLGKVLGGTALAFGQGVLFLLLSPILGIRPTLAGWAMAVALMLVMSFALTALGFCIAWRMSSTQGFHAIMNLFLMPMWFLSGALFPASGAWGPLRWVMMLNPLTYGLAGLRRAMYWGDPSVAGADLPGFGLSLVISLAFAATLFLLATVIARGNTAADLQ